MEHSSISVEDFQDYHNRPAVGDADGIIHSSPLATKDYTTSPPSATLEDDSASQSDSAHGHSSGADDEAVFDAPVSRTSSPRTSHGSSDEDISTFESTYTSSCHASGAPFTPSKTRSPFHHPSSVRAMQLDTTPPHLTTPSSQRKRLYTPSRQSSTPRSGRSGHRSTPSKLMNSSPVKTIKKEHPLVLLHITLLPIPHHYGLEILEAVLPSTIFANWKLLLERTTPTVLHRGVLIPHPREDYDVLEERLLESLELKQPRILKCGHFHLSPEEAADIEASEDEDEEDLADADICDDCGRRIRDGRYGDAGTGSKRWDVKVFAANGLMRAGAWNAAWREMERVDVEILPWMEESLRRELEFRSEEEEQVKREEKIVRKEGVTGLDDERLREIYGQDASILGTAAKVRAQDEVDGLTDGTTPPTQAGVANNLPRSPSQSPFKFDTPRRQTEDVPLWDLLRNYLYLAAQDPRNIAIWALSVVVLFLSIRSFSSSPSLHPTALLETPSQMVPTTIPATVPTAAENPVDALKNGGSSIMSASAIAASTKPGIATEKPSAEPEPPSHPEDESPDGEAAGKGGSWTEAAGDIVGGFVEEDPSLLEG